MLGELLPGGQDSAAGVIFRLGGAVRLGPRACFGRCIKMGFLRFTTPISRTDLIRDCLNELRLWPGCESVQGVGVFIEEKKFVVRVLDYGTANKRTADRAIGCIEREKQRRYHVAPPG
jgi:hypothetical protein